MAKDTSWYNISYIVTKVFIFAIACPSCIMCKSEQSGGKRMKDNFFFPLCSHSISLEHKTSIWALKMWCYLNAASFFCSFVCVGWVLIGTSNASSSHYVERYMKVVLRAAGTWQIIQISPIMWDTITLLERKCISTMWVESLDFAFRFLLKIVLWYYCSIKIIALHVSWIMTFCKLALGLVLILIWD